MGDRGRVDTGATSVLARRGLAALVDLLVIAVLSAVLAAGLFQLTAVTGAEGQTCETEVTEAVRRRVRLSENGGRPRRRWREVEVTAVPSFCVQGARARYVPLGREEQFQLNVVVGVLVVAFVDLVLVQWAARASVGKLLVGLRVVRRDGSRFGLGRMAWRWVLLGVDLCCCLAPGVVMVLVSSDHRRIGDRGSGAFVVRWSDARSGHGPDPDDG